MPRRERLELILTAVIVILGLVSSIHYLVFLWTLTAEGLSKMSGRLPYWDFTNLWAGTRMALNGHVSTLFDVEAYRREIRLLLSPLMMDQEWSYPPSMLLVGAPFAMLPIFTAYLIWTFGTLFLLFVATRLLNFPRAVGLLILCSPAACLNVVFGQNGALTTFLLLSGLTLAPKRPILGGILLGLLTIKPQIGLLVPFCLLASRNYRAILSAGLAMLLLVVATGLSFGFDSWLLFLTKTRPLMTAILEAPFPQGYQANAMTFFIIARSAGFGLAEAYGFQAIFFLFAIVAAIWLWFGRVRIDHAEKVCLTGLLGLLATPYGYVYDVIPLNIAATCLFLKRGGGLPILGLAWLYPLFNDQVAGKFLPIGIVVPLILAVWNLYRIWEEQGRMRLADFEAAKASEAPPARSGGACPSEG